MKNPGKINILVTFVFSKEEVDTDKHLLSFIPSGIVREERAPFIFLSTEVFKKLTQKDINISCYYYPWAIIEDPQQKAITVAETLVDTIVEKFSNLKPSNTEYFIIGIDHPYVNHFGDVIESLLLSRDNGSLFSLIVIDPFNESAGKGQMIDIEPFLEKKNPGINVSHWN